MSSDAQTGFSIHFDACFVGLKCYDLLRGESIPKYLGGIERALVSLAKGMASLGHKVAFIVYDEGQPEVIEHGGITVFKAYAPKAGIKFLRLIYPQATTLRRLIHSIKTDRVIQMGAGIEMTFSAHAARKKDCQFIYIIASNSDCQPELPLVSTAHEKKLYRYGLRWIDTIVAQSQNQQALLKENFGYASVVIPMPHYIEYPSNASTRQTPKAEQTRSVLWVGRIIEVKRLEWLIDLAEATPEVTYHVVGAANDASSYSTEQVARANQTKNLSYHGKVSDDELYGLFASSDILACTSSLEGFPMAFIEAWYFGMPILTTFDPDDIIAKNQLGYVASDLDSLKQGLSELLLPKHYQINSARAHAFYNKHYSISTVVPQYLQSN